MTAFGSIRKLKKKNLITTVKYDGLLMTQAGSSED